jgi:hypothetical protein
MYKLAYLETRAQLEDALRGAADRIAPVWPLENFVAVNPYSGLSDRSFEHAACELRYAAGARMIMPLAFYLDALDEGEISRRDVRRALADYDSSLDTDAFIDNARDPASEECQPQPSVPTIADTATTLTGENWTRFVTERVSEWASSYFDEGQAAWRPVRRDRTLYETWRAEAELDYTPDVMGLEGFRRAVAGLPEDPLDAAAEALSRLRLPESGLELYLHRLLLRVGGWAAYAARQPWEAASYDGESDDMLIEFLSVLLSYEVALLESLPAAGFGRAWDEARERLAQLDPDDDTDESLQRGLILHAAYERAATTRMRDQLDQHAKTAVGPRDDRPDAQAIFCIDVRSEAFRRHLEAADEGIDTLGFAGFFGFPVEYVPLGHDDGGAQCPVLIRPSHRVQEGMRDDDIEHRARKRRSLGLEVSRAWKAFKMGAISCFSFVGPVGLAYLPKLFTDSFGWTRPVSHPSEHGLSESEASMRRPCIAEDSTSGDPVGIPHEDAVEIAASALEAMSLTEDFARVVLIAGHGSQNVNNPHASALDCGACGGRSGEPNARIAAAVLNDERVRAGLAERGIAIPSDTLFVAGLHDTTTDDVEIFDMDSIPASHSDAVLALQSSLEQAGRTCRAERARQLHLAPGETPETNIRRRCRDWAQTRPEWGLAGCTTFIVAPRHRTRGLDLGGESFLHSYAWREDTGFDVLEQVMTAPMIVASWINLQYYASTVDPTVFGAGNKTLHNVVGGFGVVEGNGGDLRVGLPMQSIHDGEGFQHSPQRLRVVIEAPIDAMNDIISQHQVVRDLVENDWIHLFSMDGTGRISHQYDEQFEWKNLRTGASDASSTMDKAV